MSELTKIYWDSTCFICFLNHDERERRLICEDVLRSAQKGEIQIYTSTLTIVEVIRPKRYGSAPLPDWAEAAIKSTAKEIPDIQTHLERLWTKYQAEEKRPKLTTDQINNLVKMFEWKFLSKVDLDERVAARAVEIARDCNMKGPDSVHTASALISRSSVLQCWDRDYNKVRHLVNVAEPTYLSNQRPLIDGLVFPTPADFETDDGNSPIEKEKAG